MHAHHLMSIFQCQFTCDVWARIRDWLNIRMNMPTIASSIKWMHIEKIGTTILQKSQRITLIDTVSQLWRARNAKCSSKIPFDGNQVVTSIKRDFYTVLYSIFPMMMLHQNSLATNALIVTLVALLPAILCLYWEYALNICVAWVIARYPHKIYFLCSYPSVFGCLFVPSSRSTLY